MLGWSRDFTVMDWFNPCGAESGIFQNEYANTTAADALAPYVARPPATMVLA